MIPVAEALARCLALVRPTGQERVALREADGRVLARALTADRAQPPFPAAAMDGYAVAAASAGAQLTVVGEAAAGHAWHGRIGAGDAVRIFTGAPVPDGATRVLIQEDVDRAGETIRVRRLDEADHIRPAGSDFPAGHTVAPRRLRPADLALLAAMNHGTVPVRTRPDVALIATGDELTLPGGAPARDQIAASNIYALAAMVTRAGGTARILPIARDTRDSLISVLGLASDADIVATIGGAAVGDHDLVAGAAAALGLQRAFYKIAMRPGKPLMAGRLGRAALIGLPGNPVSAIVCGHVFLVPMVRAALGLEPAPPVRQGVLAAPVPANGPRAHYARATLAEGRPPRVTLAARQDSALLTVLAGADALAIRPPDAPAGAAGDNIGYIPLDD